MSGKEARDLKLQAIGPPISEASNANSDEGYAFRYKLPKDLALCAVAICADGAPELRFSPSLNVPTLTEDDVAAAVRLASEDSRPEFYYIPIPYGHPFFGRQYEYFSPPWLRGTSLGNLLSNADWKMKCLHIGARSDDSKTKFWDWRTTSKLEGLSTRLDFPEDEHPSGRSIIMSCKSVTVQENDQELVFPEEPRMRIDDQSNSVYSKYITEIYDSVAFYDEPTFLKMREVIKLTVAAEWLKKKGVRMSQNWIHECTTTAKQAASKAVENNLDIVHRVKAQLPQISYGSFSVVTTVDEIAVSQTSLQMKVTTSTCMQPSFPSLTVQVVMRMTPNDPLSMLISGKLVVPNAQSWSDLYSQTVPWPRVWQLPHRSIGIGLRTASGGVTTNSIPITKIATPIPCHSGVPNRETTIEQYVKYPDQNLIGVRASKDSAGRKKKRCTNLPRGMEPSLTKVKRPCSDVRVNTQEARLNKLVLEGASVGVGWEDGHSGVIHSEDGTGEHVQLNPPMGIDAPQPRASTKEERKEGKHLEIEAHKNLLCLPLREQPEVAPTNVSPTSTIDSGIAMPQHEQPSFDPSSENGSNPQPTGAVDGPNAIGQGAGPTDFSDSSSSDSGLSSPSVSGPEDY